MRIGNLQIYIGCKTGWPHCVDCKPSLITLSTDVWGTSFPMKSAYLIFSRWLSQLILDVLLRLYNQRNTLFTTCGNSI